MPVGSTNPGPAVEQTVNTQSPRGFYQFIQTIGVSLTPLALAANVSAEQSFGANGVSQTTAATGILPGDVILAINPPSTVADVVIGSYRVDVATADKFYINFGNVSATTPTPPSGIYLITVGRVIQSVTTTPGTLSTLPTSIVTTS